MIEKIYHQELICDKVLNKPLYGRGFIRKIDKSMIPKCNILGVNISAINMEWVIDFLKKHIKDLSGDYICVSNVHTTVTSYENPEYCAIQNGGIMALPDGGPLSLLGRKRGFKNMARVCGPNLMEEIFKISVYYGYRHYFYGSTETTLKKLNQILLKKYKGLQVVGMYSPPFHSITNSEDDKIIKIINEADPNFIWVGLGAPKQEMWMSTHQGKIKGLMIGVGAGFDYHAGNIKRAPKWVQNINMEWFYRLIQDPKRLFIRYLKTNTKFIWLAARENKKFL